MLAVLRIPVDVSGTVPASGMLVANHLTYLDILCLGAVFDGVLVAKSEIRRWPLLGRITAVAGTVYVDRGSIRSAAAASREIERILASGVPVLLFPEGTTSSGEDVLPFQPPLLEAAVRTGAPVWASSIRYCVAGNAPDDLAAVPYWGDMVFLPHLANVLKIPGLRASIRVAGYPVQVHERRSAALQLHATVQQLYAARQSAFQDGVARCATAPWIRNSADC